MLDKIASALKKGFEKIAGAIFLDKKTIEDIVKDLQRSLIQADVNVQLVKELGEKIRTAAADEKIKGLERKEQITKLLHDEIVSLLGGKKYELNLIKGRSSKIILVGLYGSGKTTTSGKLANYFFKRGFKTALVGLDVHRPAASEQLEQIGKKLNIPVFIDREEKQALTIYKKFENDLKNFEVVIIDSAGRHSLDKELVEEIKLLVKEIKPDYRLLILQADIGQSAKNQANEFKKNVNINGVVITRMDSSAKAGGALTACNETKAPVFFIGTGEKMNDFENFNPQSFISRLLGLGDLEGLLERVQSVVDEKSQKELKSKLEEGNFNLRDFQGQLKQMAGVGSLSKIASMIPLVGQKISDKMLDNQENKIKKWEHIIDSMTEEEINDPEIIEKQTSRLGRIAKGSGTSTSDARQLLKQYKLLKELSSGKTPLSEIDPSQGISQKQMMKLARKFGKRMKF